MSSYVVFISDLHLDPKRAKLASRFEEFLQEHIQAQAIYILGDLFDRWIGDDDPHPFYQRIMQALRQASHMTAVYVMHGNRDFLLGAEFMRKTGCQLIEDPSIVTLFGKRILLTHGDLLCSDDKMYQYYRRFIRSKWVQKGYFLLPFSTRQWLGQAARHTSQSQNRRKLAYKMNVSTKEVESWVIRHNVDCLIHGHIHKVGTHRHFIANKPIKRMVLGDWCDTHISQLIYNDQLEFDLSKAN